MSKCIYDLSEDCNNKDCVKCVIDKIRAEIEQLTITEGGEDYTRKMAELYSLKIKVLQIIDKYRGESDCRECKAEHDCYECEKYEESEEK